MMELDEYVNMFAIVNTVLIVLGVTANILGAVVLTKIQKKVSGVRLLKYLAVLDVLYLCLLFVTVCLLQFKGLSLKVLINILNIARVTKPTLLTCYTCEVYLTVLIGCQRALLLVWPHRYQVIKNESLINRILIGIFLFSIIFNVPIWFEFQYTTVELVTNVTLIPANVELKNTWFYKIYKQYLIVTFRAILPLLVLVICNISIFVAIRKRGGSASVIQTGFDLARTNVAIITMSMISYIPLALKRMIKLPVGLYQPIDMLVILNSSANFFFYCACSKLVRQTLKEIFWKRFKRNGPSDLMELS